MLIMLVSVVLLAEFLSSPEFLVVIEGKLLLIIFFSTLLLLKNINVWHNYFFILLYSYLDYSYPHNPDLIILSICYNILYFALFME